MVLNFFEIEYTFEIEYLVSNSLEVECIHRFRVNGVELFKLGLNPIEGFTNRQCIISIWDLDRFPI